MGWTQPQCGRCFEAENPGRAPVRVIEVDAEVCCTCGSGTGEGIYVRKDPRSVPFASEAS